MAKNKNKKHNQTPKGKAISAMLDERSPDRTPKDMGNFINAQRAASRPYQPNRSMLYDIYEIVMEDLHLSGIIQKRIDAVLNADIIFSKKNVEDETFSTLCKSEAFRDTTEEVMKALFWGNSGMQFMIGKEYSFYEIPRKHIKPDEFMITWQQSGGEGISYKEDPFIWVIGGRKDFGLLFKCAAYVLLKRGNWADWAQFIELFGMPVRIVYYNINDPQSKIEARKALSDTGGALELLLPEGVQLDMKDGKGGTANGELQDKFRKAINEELSVCILGNTETTTSSKSTGYAQSKTHADQQFEVTQSDLVYVINKLNSKEYLNILRSYGYNVDGGAFEVKQERDPDKVIKKLTVIEKVKKLGVPVDDDEVYETSGVSKPKDYDKQKAKMEEERLSRQMDKQQQVDKAKEEKSPGTKAALKNWLRLFQ